VALDVPKRSYTEEEVAAGLNAVLANGGKIRSTAREIGVPVMTVSQWASQSRRVPRSASEAAHRAELSTRNREDTVRRLDEVIPLALARVVEAIPDEGAYRAMLTAAIAIDKRQLLTGGVTSRTETVKARYVEGDSLRSIASRVIDVPALPAGQVRSDRTPKVAGGQVRGSYLTQPPERKEPRAKKKRSTSGRSTPPLVREVGSVPPSSETTR